ncbi:hypothetical protein OsJ_14668 [Oryza sativa Japonica Group]|uniref:Uncharacterized protein n=1 Tax=Oryza sativa subsp. japonica TaxID=39947 RepID=A3ATH7_ORYSJ|nr:hypothetical protein OsJ_14668 [Oryza sativa Japonica Group]
MAVQAQRLAQAFPYDLHAAASGGALFLDELAGECAPPMAAVEGIGGAVVFGGDNGEYGFVERKRPRVAAGLLEDQRAVLAHAMAAPAAGDLALRGCGRAGRRAPARAFHQREEDGRCGRNLARAFFRSSTTMAWRSTRSFGSRYGKKGFSVNRWTPCLCLAERMRAGLEEAQRRHVRALVAARGARHDGEGTVASKDLAASGGQSKMDLLLRTQSLSIIGSLAPAYKCTGSLVAVVRGYTVQLAD